METSFQPPYSGESAIRRPGEGRLVKICRCDAWTVAGNCIDTSPEILGGMVKTRIRGRADPGAEVIVASVTMLTVIPFPTSTRGAPEVPGDT